MTRKRWPSAASRRTLAKRLDISEKAIQSLVERQHLPPPILIGEHERWLWPDVVAFLKKRKTGETDSQRTGRDGQRRPEMPVGQAQARSASRIGGLPQCGDGKERGDEETQVIAGRNASRRCAA